VGGDGTARGREVRRAGLTRRDVGLGAAYTSSASAESQSTFRGWTTTRQCPPLTEFRERNAHITEVHLLIEKGQ
jgi:hypothetical protein